MKNTSVVYLAYHTEASLRAARFSILTLLSQLSADDLSTRIIVYTDSPGYFADLPIVLEDLDNYMVDVWQGGESTYYGYLKWQVIRDFFESYYGRLFFVESTILWDEEALEYLNNDEICVWSKLGPLKQLPDPKIKQLVSLMEDQPLSYNDHNLVPADISVFDLRVVALPQQFGKSIPGIQQLITKLYACSPIDYVRQIAASYIIGNSESTEVNANFFDWADNKHVVDQILEDFFWLNFDMPLKEQIFHSRNTRRHIMERPTFHSRNIIKRMRDLILA